MSRTLAGVAISTLLLAAGCAPMAAADEPAAARRAELAHMVRQECGSCHGLTLRGGLGPALLPQSLRGKPEEGLALTILDGRPGSAMPPWRGLLTEAEARWIVRRLIQGFQEIAEGEQ